MHAETRKNSWWKSGGKNLNAILLGNKYTVAGKRILLFFFFFFPSESEQGYGKREIWLET